MPAARGTPPSSPMAGTRTSRAGPTLCSSITMNRRSRHSPSGTARGLILPSGDSTWTCPPRGATSSRWARSPALPLNVCVSAHWGNVSALSGYTRVEYCGWCAGLLVAGGISANSRDRLVRDTAT
jgi:hypothetical protein